jgi:hypothetical protein
MWCIADLDAAYITNMEDVLALYEKPYTARSVHRTAAPTV